MHATSKSRFARLLRTCAGSDVEGAPRAATAAARLPTARSMTTVMFGCVGLWIVDVDGFRSEERARWWVSCWGASEAIQWPPVAAANGQPPAPAKTHTRRSVALQSIRPHRDGTGTLAAGGPAAHARGGGV